MLDLKIFQTLNLMYAIPIIAVILCVFFVYAFGFRTPLQPPSLVGIVEEKKHAKKRKVKETQKGKSNHAVKLNGSSSGNKHISSKKKESNEKAIAHKVSDEKAVHQKKMSKAENNKKLHEKKKENILEESNDEGWVQLISKKGKKNRKKTGGGSEISSPKSADDKPLQESVKFDLKSDMKTNEDKHQPAHVTEKNNEASKLLSVEPDSQKVGKAIITDEIKIPKSREAKKNKKLFTEKIESNFNNSVLSLQPLPDLITNKSDHLVANELSSTYVDAKKKKKHIEMALSGEDSLGSSTITTVSSLPDMIESASLTESKFKKKKNNDSLLMTDKVLSGASCGPISEAVESTIPSSPNIDNVISQQLSENKTSNVAFDELSDMYPQAKEARKQKKKVRRDH